MWLSAKCVIHKQCAELIYLTHKVLAWRPSCKSYNMMGNAFRWASYARLLLCQRTDRVPDRFSVGSVALLRKPKMTDFSSVFGMDLVGQISYQGRPDSVGSKAIRFQVGQSRSGLTNVKPSVGQTFTYYWSIGCRRCSKKSQLQLTCHRIDITITTQLRNN